MLSTLILLTLPEQYQLRDVADESQLARTVFESGYMDYKVENSTRKKCDALAAKPRRYFIHLPESFGFKLNFPPLLKILASLERSLVLASLHFPVVPGQEQA